MGMSSITFDIDYGVPQGSILGPILFPYILHLGDITHHIVKYHCYTDDILLYMLYLNALITCLYLTWKAAVWILTNKEITSLQHCCLQLCTAYLLLLLYLFIKPNII